MKEETIIIYADPTQAPLKYKPIIRRPNRKPKLISNIAFRCEPHYKMWIRNTNKNMSAFLNALIKEHFQKYPYHHPVQLNKEEKQTWQN